jgi:hypothetical protein
MRTDLPLHTSMTMDTAEQWNCPTCIVTVTTPHCPTCGERRPHPDELTVLGLCKQAIEAFTSYDSRLLRSIRTLMLQPGRLTLMYLKGSRKPFLGPIALFLLANVLFVALEGVSGSNAFASPLNRHLNEQPWSRYAQQLVTHHLQSTGTTMEAYAPVFDQAVAKNAKSFIVLMVLPLALLSALVFAGNRLPFATHLTYSLHFHAFMLVLISGTLLLAWLDTQFGGPGLRSQLLDNLLAIFLLLVCALYLYLSAGTVYQTRGWMRTFKSIVLVLAAAGIFLGYRFFLLLFTLYTT